MKDRVAAYLDAYADREAIALVDAVAGHGPWSAAVVVPARDEAAGFVRGLAPGLRERGALTIVVINEDDADQPAVLQANRVLDRALRKLGPTVELGARTVLIRSESAGDLLVLARTLPPKQGVGRARRIGLDLALGLTHGGAVTSRWLHTTDADVTLPSDYLTAPIPDGAVACVRPFFHVPAGDARLDRATALYEITLRYYVAGLAAAHSPWAMHTIGSCLTFDAEAYAAVRGLPVRPAAEDFYLLAKLAKLGLVVRGGGTPLAIASRWSARVPFGTGPGTAAIARTLDDGATPTVYAPASFGALHEVVEALTRWSAGGQGSPREAVGRDVTDTVAAAAFDDLSPDKLEAAMRGATTSGQRLRRVHEWLDAFRTLKLVHRLRDRGHAEVAWPEAVAAVTGRAGSDDVLAVRAALASAEPDLADAGLAAGRRDQ